MKNRLIKNFREFKLLEMTEFNLQRLNPESINPINSVDNPQLSINAFDKHEDLVRQSISRLGQLQGSIMGNSSYKILKSKLSLESQNIKSLKVLRVLKNENLNWNVYISFVIDDIEYWGVVKNMFSDPKLDSEVFKDLSLIQTKEWVIKLEGLIIKNLSNFFKVKSGTYKQIKDEVICYSLLEGKLLKMKIGTEIDVLKSSNDNLVFRYKNEKFKLKDDNFAHFNWWFEKLEEKKGI